MRELLYALIEHRSGRGGVVRHPLGVVVVRAGDNLISRVLDVPNVAGADSVRIGLATRAIVARLRREAPQNSRELEMFAAKEANEVGLSKPQWLASELSADDAADLLFNDKVRQPTSIDSSSASFTNVAPVTVEMCNAEPIIPNLPSFELGAYTFTCGAGAATTPLDDSISVFEKVDVVNEGVPPEAIPTAA